MKRAVFTLLLGALAAPPALAQEREDDWLRPIGREKEASQKRIKAGESFAPLPLPATPLRRTERKRPPSPPLLIGKVVWGAGADFELESGRTLRVEDWNMAPADTQQLLRVARKHLGLEYRADTVRLSEFEPDPTVTPVLYFSGARTLRLTSDQKLLLRKFALRGGMIWFDSIAGSPYFTGSVRRLVSELFPEEKLRVLPLEHPLFNMIAAAQRLKGPIGANASMPGTAGGTRPVLEGLYIGCRVAAVLSPAGVGAGWDRAEPRLIPKATYYDVRTATELGLNLVSYAIGYARLGLAHARAQLVDPVDDDASGEFVLAQVKHGGVWNTDPGGPANLLKVLATTTNIRVTLRQRSVVLGRDDLSGIGFLYFSGVDDFVLTQEERAALRAFLARGGTALFDSSLGLTPFVAAVRRELAALLPSQRPATLAPDHLVFSAFHRLERVGVTPALARRFGKLVTPALEGITVDGRTAVFVSPFDLGGGWQGDAHPQARGYLTGDALKVGVNLVTYAMTH
ncbi:MAG: DUF4159 domain-containing protein [Planctomycetota bacterium]|jgi:hypothetical protein